MEAGGGELLFEAGGVGDAELDFGFDGAHDGPPVEGEYTTG